LIDRPIRAFLHSGPNAQSECRHALRRRFGGLPPVAPAPGSPLPARTWSGLRCRRTGLDSLKHVSFIFCPCTGCRPQRLGSGTNDASIVRVVSQGFSACSLFDSPSPSLILCARMAQRKLRRRRKRRQNAAVTGRRVPDLAPRWGRAGLLRWHGRMCGGFFRGHRPGHVRDDLQHLWTRQRGRPRCANQQYVPGSSGWAGRRAIPEARVDFRDHGPECHWLVARGQTSPHHDCPTAEAPGQLRLAAHPQDCAKVVIISGAAAQEAR
jgi:hypothetical protein